MKTAWKLETGQGLMDWLIKWVFVECLLYVKYSSGQCAENTAVNKGWTQPSGSLYSGGGIGGGGRETSTQINM